MGKKRKQKLNKKPKILWFFPKIMNALFNRDMTGKPTHCFSAAEQKANQGLPLKKCF